MTAVPDAPGGTPAPRTEPVSSARLVLTLAVAGMLSGAILVGVYLLTAPIIAQNRAEALAEAVYEVLPGARSQAAYVFEGSALTAWPGPDAAPPDAVYAGFDADGRLVGYAIPSEGAGFQDKIKLLFGWRPAGERVIGMQVLESRETPGLGDKIFKDASFVAQFRDLAARPAVTVTKKGRSAPHELDAITGATISSQAVARIINDGVTRWAKRLPAEPPPAPAPREASP